MITKNILLATVTTSLWCWSSVVGASCGDGNVGSGICPDTSLCCSEWGYCGSTEAYCGGGTTPVAPTNPAPISPTPRAPVVRNVDCENVPEAMTMNFGYYQSWAIWRKSSCNPVLAADINVDDNGYTHLAYSFAGIDAEGKLEPWNGDYNGEVQQYADFNAIKANHPNLKTMIAVGGWTFNDPGATQTRFSTVASTEASRSTFANSVVDFLHMVRSPQFF